MNTPTALRSLRSLQPSICSSCRSRLLPSTLRAFSTSTPLSAAPNHDALGEQISKAFARPTSAFAGIIPESSGEPFSIRNLSSTEWEEEERHHLHIYATKHNTHITLSQPNRDPLISVSCGNIGFRKAGRGTYDAAYQLAAFVMSRIQDKGLLVQIKKLEVVYRGFGAGREAVTKAILGNEGKKVRPLIVRLTDSTRLKFGGVRSKKPRRLG
ncbi:hypothetical protein BDV96DRAFT_652767 [Lophiotrema nucula]|uniref:Small ribosomal subunit protein uS11m n=1 Tax=Lophiotrema nucula TaxID=690887 RepID=A0A6A5YN03_9PLEO|nr:hypothetical protein BDV96DRAFT_652767 [Lophiotrema nucula]